MVASGVWRGFWEQRRLGRQEMQAFELHFAGGRVKGRGVDVVGLFAMTGDYDTATGRVRLVKQYVGKHKVEYAGEPDGEGCILGTWRVATAFAGAVYEDTGPFLMRPELARPTGDEPVAEIVPG